MTIDWSKAPEGATHFYIVNKGFYKFTPEQTGFFSWSGFEPSGRGLDFYPAGSMIPRPEAWTGEGLPPVGTVCELSSQGADWGIGTIQYTADNVIVWRWENQAAGQACAYYKYEIDIRPVRTPEQIAAEEREKAVQQMLEDTTILSAIHANRRLLCEELHKAGYRKQVAP